MKALDVISVMLAHIKNHIIKALECTCNAGSGGTSRQQDDSTARVEMVPHDRQLLLGTLTLVVQHTAG